MPKAIYLKNIAKFTTTESCFIKLCMLVTNSLNCKFKKFYSSTCIHGINRQNSAFNCGILAIFDVFKNCF